MLARFMICAFGQFKVHGYTFRGGNSVIYIFASPLKTGLLSNWSKFCPLRINPRVKELCQLGKQIGSQESCSPY